MSEVKQRCKERIFSGARWDIDGHRCANYAVDGMDGFCSAHYPPNVKERRQKLVQKWEENSFKHREAEQKEKEDRRRAQCFPDLLEALKAVLDSLGALSNPSELINRMGEKDANIVFAAIAKAENRP